MIKKLISELSAIECSFFARFNSDYNNNYTWLNNVRI